MIGKVVSTVTIHMVSSLDGFIAKPDNSVQWFETAHDHADGAPFPEPDSFFKGVDCFVVGARTYEHTVQIGWP